MAGYVLYSSFGGKLLSRHRSLSAATKAAKKHKQPVDIWRSKGGAFGHGKVVKHVKNPAPSAIPSKWTNATVTRKGRQIQIRMGGR